MVQWDQLLQRLLETLIQVIGPILVAAVSGYFLLRSHHAKVRAELFYPRKQAAYDAIWSVINDTFDYTQGLLDETNWRKVRSTQTGHLLAGSREVVDLFNAIMRVLEKEPPTEEELKNQDLEITRLEKELWNAMRKDLYRVSALPQEAIRFVGPGRKTTRGIEILGKHRKVLESKGLDTLEALSKMDVNQLSQDTRIPLNDLAEVRRMAIRELTLMRELKDPR